MGAAIGVVIQSFDLGLDAILVAAEIHHAVVLLVASALVAHGDAAVVVAAAVLGLALDERPVWLALVQIGRDHLDESAAAG